MYHSALQSTTTMPLQMILPLLPLSSISILLQALVNQYLSDSYCLTFVLEQPIDFKINVTFTSINPDYGTVDNLTKQLVELSENGCSDYIVYMRDPKLFMTAVDQTSRYGKSRRSNRKLIILPLSADRKFDVLSMNESMFIANILMVLPKEDSSTDCDIFDLVTHEFISLDNDQPLYLDQWNSCTQEFSRDVNLFPHDLRDLKGRVLRVACFTYSPYVLLNLDPALAPLQRDGIEIRMINEFCRWVNCTIEIVNEEKDQWGDIYENRTGIGVLGSVLMDEADIGISALYSWYSIYMYLEFSAPAIRSGVICVAPSPRPVASWEMPLMPFNLYMWSAIVVYYFAAVFGLMVAKKSTDKVFLAIFGMIVLQPLADNNNSWRIRGITGWILLASLILVSAYGAGLASTFTVPKYEPSIDTMQDLVYRKMEWGAAHDAWLYSLLLSNESLIQQLRSQFKVYSAEELKRRSFTGDMAFSIEKLEAGSFAIGDYITKDALKGLTLMVEEFYYEQCVVAMRKSSIYREKMSELIGRLHQSGLLLTWETQVALKYLNFEVQQAVKLSRDNADAGFTIALNLHHVVGVYFLFIIGVVLASLIFVGELIVYRRAMYIKMESK